MTGGWAWRVGPLSGFQGTGGSRLWEQEEKGSVSEHQGPRPGKGSEGAAPGCRVKGWLGEKVGPDPARPGILAVREATEDFRKFFHAVGGTLAPSAPFGLVFPLEPREYIPVLPW